MELYNEDCLERLKKIPDKSIDLIFNDLPYCGITNSKKDSEIACKWNTPINLEELWKQYRRIRKDTTAIFFTCSTKFGVSLINSNPKEFRYDLIFLKSSPCGFLNAKRQPLRKHEMIYVFYKRLPFYDLSSHKHKFLKETENKRKTSGKGVYTNGSKTETSSKYTPPLPVSVIKEEEVEKIKGCSGNNCYGKFEYYNNGEKGYEPKLPVSVLKEEELEKTQISKKMIAGEKNIYGNSNGGTIGNIHGTNYDPPLPVSVIKQDVYNSIERFNNGKLKRTPRNLQKGDEPIYDPPLPVSVLEIKSQKGKHPTQKPDALMEWILKYYSRENDIIFDPTMGCGSMGVACKKMNRRFIGCELDKDIYNDALERINN